MNHKNILSMALTALMAGAIMPAAFAGDGKESRAHEWKEKHPRRAEVNQRLENQDRRIDREVKEGDMSKTEAGKLHREDRRIRAEERQMAAKDGGHITKAEQRTLNRRENTVSKQIGQ